MNNNRSVALVWFRQDLRLNENPAFFEACMQHDVVIPVYVYDEKTSLLGEAQGWWLYHSLLSLKQSLDKQGLCFVFRQGDALTLLLALIKEYSVHAVYWNRCYEPHAIARDSAIKTTLLRECVSVKSFNGRLLNEPWTIQNKSGGFFKVFTPYWQTCRARLISPALMPIPRRVQGIMIDSHDFGQLKTIAETNWARSFQQYWCPGEHYAQKKLDEFINYYLTDYKKNRDFPAKQVTSNLSPYLHFGEISPWTIVRAIELAMLDQSTDLVSAEHFLSELGWREFSTYLLYHFPTLASENFKQEFNAFPWQDNEEYLLRWQKAKTGYPVIDAGMRELWATGFMHNRVRMLVASFLTKDLFMHWRHGADWFLDTLLDADLANNSASWQWVAGCGVDAAPYFRIFNPILQSKKFDPDGTYIRRWLPELSSLDATSIHQPWVDASSVIKTGYPRPMVEHHERRNMALEYYKCIKLHLPSTLS